MSSIFILPFQDIGGGIKPADGAKLLFWETDVVTPKDTFTTEAATIAHANPVIANSLGVFPEIWLVGEYVAVLTDKDDVQIWQSQPFESSLTNADIDAELAERAITKATIAAAKADDDLFDLVGGYVRVAEYTAGNPIDSLYLVASGHGTDDGFQVHNSDTGTLFQLQLVQGQAVDVHTAGATGDGTTDDIAALSTVFDYVRTVIANKGSLLGTLTVDFGGEKNDYLVSAPVNATGIRQPVNIQMNGGVIFGDFDDTGPVLDLVDSRFVKVWNGKIKNASGKVPMCGVLQGRRASDDRVASDIGLINVQITGDFAITAWANISSEESLLQMTRFENNHAGTTSEYSGILSDANTYGLASTHQTLTSATVSNVMHTWIRASFRRRNSNGGVGLEINGAQRLQGDYVYLLTQGDNGATYDAKASVRMAALVQADIKFYSETEVSGGGAESIGLIEAGSFQRNDLEFSGPGETSGSTEVLLIDEVAEVKDCTLTAAGIKVEHTTSSTFMRHCTLKGNNGGFVDLAGAKMFTGDIWIDSDTDFTTLGANTYDLYARFIYEASIQTPRTPRATTLSTKALVNPRPYSQISGTGDFETITDGNSYFRDGASLLVRAVTGSTVTVKHNIGNIKTKSNSDFVLPTNSPVEFIFDVAAGSIWLCME